MKIEDIPVESLHLETANFSNPRNKVASTGITELASSIHARGLMYSLVVWQDGEQYAVLEGGRRLRAIRYLIGKKKGALFAKGVPCHVVHAGSAREAMVLALTGNLAREDLTSFESASRVVALLADGMTQQDVANSIGKSPAWVSRQKNAIRHLSSTLLRAWEDGRISHDDAEKLRKLDHAQQDAIWEGLVEARATFEAAGADQPAMMKEWSGYVRAQIKELAAKARGAGAATADGDASSADDTNPHKRGSRKASTRPQPNSGPDRPSDTAIEELRGQLELGRETSRLQGMKDALDYVLGRLYPIDFAPEARKCLQAALAKARDSVNEFDELDNAAAELSAFVPEEVGATPKPRRKSTGKVASKSKANAGAKIKSAPKVTPPRRSKVAPTPKTPGKPATNVTAKAKAKAKAKSKPKPKGRPKPAKSGKPNAAPKNGVPPDTTEQLSLV